MGDTVQNGALVRQAAAGNRGAFSELVRLHRVKVLRIAYGIVGTVQEAEDVAQQALLKAWRRLPELENPNSFAGWLNRITVNVATDHCRRRRATAELSGREVDLTDDPLRSVLRTEQRERVRAAVQALPPKARAALVLREYQGLSYQEIASALGVPMGTVMSRLNYARTRLASALLDQDGQGER